MNTPSTKSLRSTTTAYADEALSTAETALDSTRQLATQMLGRASEKVRDLRSGASEFATRGVDAASEAAALAQKQISRYADVTGRYVSQQPVKSVLIAVAAGAVIAGLVAAARRRNRY